MIFGSRVQTTLFFGDHKSQGEVIVVQQKAHRVAIQNVFIEDFRVLLVANDPELVDRVDRGD